MSGISVPQSFALRSFTSSFQSRNHGSVNPTSYSLTSSIMLKKHLPLRFGTATTGDCRRIKFRCNSTTGDDESKKVLDAFFLGKALAEELNERIGSAVGEFLSVIGRLQAEQQKQIQELQKDVLDRAKKAKENAAREAMEAQGLAVKPVKSDASTATNGVDSATSSSTTEAMEAQGLVSEPVKNDASTATNGVDSATSSSTTDGVAPANSPSSLDAYAASTSQDPASGALDED